MRAILAFFHWPKASESGALEVFAFFLHALERGRFAHLHADPDGNTEQENRYEERNTPAPGREGVLAEQGLGAQDHEQRQEQAERCRGLDP